MPMEGLTLSELAQRNGLKGETAMAVKRYAARLDVIEPNNCGSGASQNC